MHKRPQKKTNRAKQQSDDSHSQLSRSTSKKDTQTPIWAKSKPVQLQSLTVNQPNDPYERQAEQVANQVMRMPSGQVQRCACGGITGKDGECPACRAKRLQRSSTSDSGDNTAPASVNSTINRSGRSLDNSTRQFMESRFNTDFSGVRVHTDKQAAQSAADVNAAAYTVGNHIVFGAGHYQPNSTRGKHLLAHELTHTIQQNEGQASRVQRWTYGTGSHNTSGGNTFREVTADERTGANGLDSAMAIVDRLVTDSDWRAENCQQWFDDNCNDPRTLTQLNNRAVIWMWREADGSGGNGLTDGGSRENHAVTEQLFNVRSKWALAATILHEYWHDCDGGAANDIGDDAKEACGLPNI